MNIVNKFLNGLYLSANSFNILWKNKKLILYLGVPIAAKAILDMIIYNLYVDPASFSLPFFNKEPILLLMKIAESQNWISYLLIFLVNFIFLSIMTIASVALTVHINKLGRNKKTNKISIIQTLSECKDRVKKAIIWTLIVFIPIILKNYTHKVAFLNKRTISWLSIIMFLAWSLATAFVIQVIAINNFGILKSIKKSVSAIKLLFIDYLGAIFWLGLILLLSLTPLILLERYFIPAFKSQIILIILYSMMTLVGCIIPTAYTIAKTMLYKQFLRFFRAGE